MLSELLGSWTVEKTEIPDAAKAYWMHFCEDAYCAQETLTDLGWLRAWRKIHGVTLDRWFRLSKF